MTGAEESPSRQSPARIIVRPTKLWLLSHVITAGMTRRRAEMLYWALVFLVIALVAGALGFGGIAGASAGIAKILFFIFLVLLLISLVMHFMRGTAP
jgi:uncharacterized membrane protein YtjA (UPF0391 family)